MATGIYKHKLLTEEHKKNISDSMKGNKNCLGRTLSDEHKRKIGEAGLGRIHSEETKIRMSEIKKGKSLRHSGSFKQGHEVPKEWRESVAKAQWKGDDVGYFALHTWIRKELGKPDTCEHCGRSNLSGRFIQWANKSRKYKRDLTDWIRLCVRCHRIYDGLIKV